jgi:hypothetical protein
MSLPPGVDVSMLSEAAERHTPALECLDGVDQVAQAAAQPVEPPDDDGVTRSELLKHRVKGWSMFELPRTPWR